MLVFHVISFCNKNNDVNTYTLWSNWTNVRHGYWDKIVIFMNYFQFYSCQLKKHMEKYIFCIKDGQNIDIPYKSKTFDPLQTSGSPFTKLNLW